MENVGHEYIVRLSLSESALALESERSEWPFNVEMQFFRAMGDIRNKKYSIL